MDNFAAHKPTIPSTMAEEKAANPFLRADVPEVAGKGEGKKRVILNMEEKG